MATRTPLGKVVGRYLGHGMSAFQFLLGHHYLCERGLLQAATPGLPRRVLLAPCFKGGLCKPRVGLLLCLPSLQLQ